MRRSLRVGGEMLSFSVLAAMVGWIGTTSLAAYQIVNQYIFLVIIPIFALSQASGILIGQANGAKQTHEIKMLGQISLLVVLSITLPVAFVFMFIPNQLASLYLNIHNPANQHTLKLVGLLFSVVAFTQIFDGLRNILVGILRGLFDTRFSMVVSLVNIWLICVPLSYILAFNFNLGVFGIVLGVLISMIIGTVVLYYRWERLSELPLKI